ncbi:MAG: aminotransferase class I/II-fold pyridoxal phosphate-dependent enzyme [Chloroflexota bacterium]|nr:aminotransferase class I/II-fold pyridoxal phosphate-dependent enzyme [Chloroflexota bacterium]
MDDQPISRRVSAIGAAKPFGLLFEFFNEFDYAERRQRPGTLDFTFGDPHEMPSSAYVDALAACLEPENELWFAYKQNEPAAREAAAASLRRVIDLPFEADDIFLTTGGFAAIALAMKAVADPGDEVIYSLPPWFLYEALVLEAGLVPVKVGIDPETFDLDVDAIAAAITPRTRIVIVCTPNNPTGRIYPAPTLERLAALLDEASARNGRRIYLLSDEPYQRIVYDGGSPRSPLQFYPYSFLAYSYGKTLLAPGQRMGYLALPPAMPDRPAMRDAIQTLQIATGWVYPNAVLQYALPHLEELAFDIDLFQRKRNLMVDALSEIGYHVRRPEGAFYLFPESPIPDDGAFADILAEMGVLVMPGRMFETPGFFRISLTATLETIEASLPRFATAFVQATAVIQ